MLLDFHVPTCTDTLAAPVLLIILETETLRYSPEGVTTVGLKRHIPWNKVFQPWTGFLVGPPGLIASGMTTERRSIIWVLPTKYTLLSFSFKSWSCRPLLCWTVRIPGNIGFLQKFVQLRNVKWNAGGSANYLISSARLYFTGTFTRGSGIPGSNSD